MSEKKSQFIEVETLTDSQLIPVFGSGVDRKISKPNLFKQIKDESFSPFIYPTIAILQSADLEVDVDNPTYCRCEETEYRLYKITNAAPGVDDITLTNGNTAEYQIEYRDTGFVTSVATAATGALAVFTDSTGQEIDKSVVPTNTGKALVQAADSASIAFPRKNADNTVTMRSASQYFDDIKQSATHGAAGVIKTADGTSTLAQTATDEAITPANLATLKASNAETLTGTDDTKYITPENLQYKLESDGVLIIDNFAALASTPAVAGTVYYLKEYYDGTGYGGGDLEAYTGVDTPDNGIIFASGTAGVLFKRINYVYLDVRMFGAKGDGSTDDTAALQACFDAATNWPAVASIVPVKLSSGTYKTTSSLNIRTYLSIYGDGNARSIIKPTMSSGAAFVSNAESGTSEAYLQRFVHFAIDGANCTGSAYAWQFRGNKHSNIEQIRFWNFETSSPAVSIESSLYHLRFTQCNWLNNNSHLQGIPDDIAAGEFPTIVVFDTCVFEESASLSATAITLNDCSAFRFLFCIFQANLAITTIAVNATNAASIGADHIFYGCWYEDNGGAQANSQMFYLKGVAAKKVTGVRIIDGDFHQAAANKPQYQIRVEYCDKIYIDNCSEGFGGTFLKDSGNNTNIYIDERNVSACELHYPSRIMASGNFGGKTSITIHQSFGVSGIVRNAAGDYTVTLSEAMSTARYTATANAEDGSTYNALLCSTIIVSTTQFKILVASNSSTLVDGREINFTVSGY